MAALTAAPGELAAQVRASFPSVGSAEWNGAVRYGTGSLSVVTSGPAAAVPLAGEPRAAWAVWAGCAGLLETSTRRWKDSLLGGGPLSMVGLEW